MSTGGPIVNVALLDMVTSVARRICGTADGGSKPANWDDMYRIAVECYQLGELNGFRTAAARSGFLALTREHRDELLHLLRAELQRRQPLKWRSDRSTTVLQTLEAQVQELTVPA